MKSLLSSACEAALKYAGLKWAEVGSLVKIAFSSWMRVLDRIVVDDDIAIGRRVGGGVEGEEVVARTAGQRVVAGKCRAGKSLPAAPIRLLEAVLPVRISLPLPPRAASITTFGPMVTVPFE